MEIKCYRKILHISYKDHVTDKKSVQRSSKQLDHTKILSVVSLLDLNPHWLSDVFSCAIVGMSVFSETRAKILPAMEIRVMPQ